MDEGQFMYSSLETNELRLLVLLPGLSGDSIQCTLVVGPMRRNSYDALSYAWGPSQPSETILVNGCPFSIRQNLGLALNVLRHAHLPRCLWIDAICINQANDDERGAQVAIMSTIFRTARKVLLWLGEGNQGSDFLFDLLAELEGRFDMLDSMVAIWSSAGIDVERFQKARIVAELLAICRREYWTRVWIIQEILSASSLEVMCGSKKLAWSVFATCLHAAGNLSVSSSTGSVDSCARTPAYIITAKRSDEKQSYAMEDLVLLCSYCKSQCHDIRDRIYGLVSLASDFQIVPDYTKSRMEIMIHIIQKYYFRGDEGALRQHSMGVDFLSNARELLEDPLWDIEERCFSPIQDRFLPRISLELEVIEHGSITSVGPVISPLNLFKVRSVVALFPTDVVTNVATKDMIWNLKSLASRDFHQTQAIGDWYCNHRTPDSLLRASNCYKPITNHSVGVSDGQFRTFFTSNDKYGIASSLIEVSDILCWIPGINNFVVLRANEASGRLLLIGQTRVFRFDSHAPSRPSNITWDVKHYTSTQSYQNDIADHQLKYANLYYF